MFCDKTTFLRKGEKIMKLRTKKVLSLLLAASMVFGMNTID